jgi:hypothetical protein
LTSQYVLDEAGRGDPELAAERLRELVSVPLLDLPTEVADLADRLLARAILPAHARLDALHISVAAYHALDDLLTWNCSHIANARILPKLRFVMQELGYLLPTVCTPEEMSDDEKYIE